jgi:hypothetical protein
MSSNKEDVSTISNCHDIGRSVGAPKGIRLGDRQRAYDNSLGASFLFRSGTAGAASGHYALWCQALSALSMPARSCWWIPPASIWLPFSAAAVTRRRGFYLGASRPRHSRSLRRQLIQPMVGMPVIRRRLSSHRALPGFLSMRVALDVHRTVRGLCRFLRRSAAAAGIATPSRKNKIATSARSV